MQEYWKIIYKENGESKEETVTTLEDFESRIDFIWFNIDGGAQAISGSFQ